MSLVSSKDLKSELPGSETRQWDHEILSSVLRVVLIPKLRHTLEGEPQSIPLR
jgi:hypothetical protein